MLPQSEQPLIRQYALHIRWLASGVYILGFLLFDKVSKLFEIWPGVSVWFPASGLSLLLILMFGVELAPALIAANLLSSMVMDGNPFDWYTIGSSLSHACFYTVAGWLLRRIPINQQLQSVRAVVQFVLVAVVVPFPIGLISCGTLVLTGSLASLE